MWKKIEIGGKFCINDFDMSGADQLVDVPYRVQCTAVAPIGVLFRLEVGLENGSSTKTATIIGTRSRRAGTPNGRCVFPSGFGIQTRRTGSGR